MSNLVFRSGISVPSITCKGDTTVDGNINIAKEMRANKVTASNELNVTGKITSYGLSTKIQSASDIHDGMVHCNGLGLDPIGGTGSVLTATENKILRWDGKSIIPSCSVYSNKDKWEKYKESYSNIYLISDGQNEAVSCSILPEASYLLSLYNKEELGDLDIIIPATVTVGKQYVGITRYLSCSIKTKYQLSSLQIYSKQLSVTEQGTWSCSIKTESGDTVYEYTVNNCAALSSGPEYSLTEGQVIDIYIYAKLEDFVKTLGQTLKDMLNYNTNIIKYLLERNNLE